MRIFRTFIILLFLTSLHPLTAQVDLQNTESVFHYESKEKVDEKPKMSFTVGGRIKFLGIFDFKGLQDDEAFNIFKIPVGEANTKDSRFFGGVEQSRLKFDIRYNDKEFKEIRAYIEGDFASNNNTFRLRHAYIKVGRFMLGQYWSVFADEEAFPMVVDIDGPATSVFQRSPQIRYTAPINKNLDFVTSLEYTTTLFAADSSIDSLVSPTYQSMPDLLAHFRYKQPWGHFQLAGVIRAIGYKSDRSTKNEFGYGGATTLVVNLSKTSQDNVMLQFVTGNGVAKYLSGFSFSNIDAVPNGNGGITTLHCDGGYVAYQTFYRTKKLHSTIIYGYAALRTGNLFEKSNRQERLLKGNYFSANVGYNLLPQFQVVLEGLYGNKTDVIGQTGNAARIQFMTRFDF